MIGSFWNLCRACPSMPVDKLHSEYRSTYRWHEYTGSRQDVVRRPPQPNAAVPSLGENQKGKLQNVQLKEEDGQSEGCKMEPAMPRRKKHPELAYRTHEFLAYEEDGSNDSGDVFIRTDRARSEERAGYHLRSSRRSRSEGPPRGPAMNNISCRNEITRRRDSDPDLETMGAAEEGGLLRKAISRISTEYRLQFAWPPGHNSHTDSHQSKDGSLPRKSLSMGAIKPSAQSIVHKKRNELDTKDVSELEPLVNDNGISEKNIKNEKLHPKEFNTEYKKKFRPFSQYDYLETEGRFANKDDGKLEQGALIETSENGPNLLYGKAASGWFKEVVELRKKADEYKYRGWGTELAPEHITELYNKQIELWEQVSRRSSLSALSLASTTRKSFTKEEKEEENNKKSSPTKALTNTKNAPYRKGRDSTDNSARAMKEMIRHHLERTTGGSEYDGLILSPTREKLEPTIPKKHDDHPKPSQKETQQKSSPKKDSPQKSKRAIQKTNTTKSALRTIRSQSVGPVDVTEKSSPKRLSRSMTVKQQKTPRDSASSPPSSAVPRPRPSSLNTTAFPRSKCSTVPPKSAPSEDRLSNIKTNKTLKDNSTFTTVTNSNVREQSHKPTADPAAVQEKCTVPPDDEINCERDQDVGHVVKSPPEPTRVKSPEQIMMRSPDPVNWTVPLDTGKTFTVTQNVREGDLMNRPHSEVKAWTPPDLPPPAAQSAPPELAEQAKAQAWKAVESGAACKHQNEQEQEYDEQRAHAPCTTSTGIPPSVQSNIPANTSTITVRDDDDDDDDDKPITDNDKLNVDATAISSSSTEATSEVPVTATAATAEPTNTNTTSTTTATSTTATSSTSGQSCTESNPAPLSQSATAAAAAAGPYKILEAPSPTTATAPGRSLASEVLEKARNRFDKFWGKNKQDSWDDTV